MEQLTISRQKMSEALAMLCKATSARTVPLLQYVILTSDNDSLFMRTTNLELTILRTIKIPGHLELSGDNWQRGKLLPGPFVLNLLSKSREERVVFSWEQGEADDTLVMQMGKHRSRINNVPFTDEFPVMPEVNPNGIAFNGMDLERLLGLSLPFTSRETPVQVFNCILLCIETGRITAVGTDRHRLARIRLDQGALVPAMPISCILPGNQLKTVIPFIGNDRVDLSISDKFACFSGSGWQAIITLMECVYPDIGEIIPKEHQLQIECEKDSLLLALKLCSEVSDWNPAVEMHLDEQLSIQNRGAYGEALQPFEGSIIEGNELAEKHLDVIRFNWHFLHDTVKQIPSRQVILETSGYTRPVIVYGKTQPANWEETYLLMPLRREEIETQDRQEAENVSGQEGAESIQNTGQENQGIPEPEEYPEMDYVCGNCEFYESDMCLGNSPQPDEPCCDKFHPKAIAEETVQGAQGQDGPETVILSTSADEHYCGECALFTTNTCPNSSESEEAPACGTFSLNQELVGAQT